MNRIENDVYQYIFDMLAKENFSIMEADWVATEAKKSVTRALSVLYTETPADQILI